MRWQLGSTHVRYKYPSMTILLSIWKGLTNWILRSFCTCRMVWRFAQSTITNSPRLKSTALSKFNIRCSVHLVLISKGFLHRLVLLLQPIFFFASQRNVHGNSISHSHICLPVFYLYSPCCVGQNTPKVCLGICTAQTKLQLTVISTCTLPWKTVKDC